MKKTFAILMITFPFYCFKSKAQITLDTSIAPWNGFGYDFYPVQISSNETKYVIEDTATNTFHLYNMDFTPFMQNIAVPVPFYTGANFVMVIMYLSRSLSDCDTSNIEYAYSVVGSGIKPFYIMRTVEHNYLS